MMCAISTCYWFAATLSKFARLARSVTKNRAIMRQTIPSSSSLNMDTAAKTSQLVVVRTTIHSSKRLSTSLPTVQIHHKLFYLSFIVNHHVKSYSRSLNSIFWYQKVTFIHCRSLYCCNYMWNVWCTLHNDTHHLYVVNSRYFEQCVCVGGVRQWTDDKSG